MDVYEWIYDWCGSAFCMADDKHPRGVCACRIDREGLKSFDMTIMPPCTREHCPILKDFVAKSNAVGPAITWLKRCFPYVPDCPWRDDLRKFIERMAHGGRTVP